MTFSGFADDRTQFFRALAKHQTREWYQAHKAELEEGYQKPMKALLTDLRERVDDAFPHVDLGEPKIFRIFRDVRFSKDKSPYKTHIGGLLTTKRTGKVTEVPMALYLHVGLPESFAAAGHYMMDPRALAAFRKAVDDDASGRELVKIITKLEKKGYVMGSKETLQRVPKGFDPEHPRAEHLKRKGLTVRFHPVPKGMLASPKLASWLATEIRGAAPLIEWLVFATR